MTPPSDIANKLCALAQWIREHLSGGITLSEETCGYAEQVLGGVTAHHFSPDRPAIDDSERMSVLDLFFSPDMLFKTALEPHLVVALAPQQINRLIQQLQSDPPRALFIFPDRSETVQLQLPPDITGMFLQRLNLNYAQDDRLRRDLAGTLRTQLRWQLLVWLRDHQLAINRLRREALLKLSRRMTSPTEVTSALHLLVHHFAHHTDTEDLYGSLIKRKKSLFLALQRHRQQLQARHRYPMEVLIMQGVRSSGANPDQMQHEMQTIDMVARALYGHTEYFEAPESETSLTNAGDATTVNAFIKRS